MTEEGKEENREEENWEFMVVGAFTGSCSLVEILRWVFHVIISK